MSKIIRRIIRTEFFLPYHKKTMEEPKIDKRKIMSEKRTLQLASMREKLAVKKAAEKKRMEELEAIAASVGKPKPRKSKATPKEEQALEQEIEDLENAEEEESESEDDAPAKPVKKPTKPLSKPSTKRNTKEQEIYDLGYRSYKENKKKALFDEVRNFIVQEFGPPPQEEEEEFSDEEQQDEDPQPQQDIFSIF